MTMEDWAKRIDKFIDVADLPILQDNGNVSVEFAKEFAETEFEKYRVIKTNCFNPTLTDSAMVILPLWILIE